MSVVWPKRLLRIMSKPTALIVAGGTGGHIFPAKAVAQALRACDVDVAWLGAHIGMERRLVADQFPFYAVPAYQLRGKGLMAKLLMPWRLMRATYHAMQIVRRLRPRFVIAFGGYVSVPTVLAAWLLRVPIYIHEQNARAGLANRLLARVAKRVFQAFPDTFASSVHAQTVGNPIRQALLDVPNPATRLNVRTGPLRLLVLGGSLGAQAINEAVSTWWRTFRQRSTIALWHQCGQAHVAQMQAAYGATVDDDVRVMPFIDDMAAALAWADLVICRAGALTVSELAAVGVPAIFVPMPWAVDNHQWHNAHYLTAEGAGFMLEQSALSSDALTQRIQPFLNHRSALLVVANKACQLAFRDATLRILQEITEISLK